MFRKKQTPAPKTRTAHQPGRAQVFSYYANRTPEPTGIRSEKKSTATGRRTISLKRWLAYIPSVVAGLALAACLAYNSTLGTDANIQIIAGSTSEHRLAAKPEVYQEEFESILAKSILNRSKLLIDTDAVAHELSNEFPELGDISVVLPLVGRRPIVRIQPAEPALTLVASGGPYVVGMDGRVLAYSRDIDSATTEGLPTVRDESSLRINRGNIVITQSTIAFIREVAGQLTAANVKLESISLPQANAGELHVRLTGQPYFVKFDIRGKGRKQAGTLLAVKQHLEQKSIKPAEYIDVRVAGKVFYR